MRPLAWLLLGMLLIQPAALQAHPVPRKSHDRTILVRVVPNVGRAELRVAVEYRLDVDELTVVLDDLPAVADRVDLARLQEADQLYSAYTRAYGPILAANLLATLDGRPLQFRCTRSSHTLRDDDGTPLGHLRCRFLFESRAQPLTDLTNLARCWPAPGLLPTILVKLSMLNRHCLTFKESNYELEHGTIGLGLAADPALPLFSKDEPPAVLQARSAAELGSGDDARLRSIRADFALLSISNRPPGQASMNSTEVVSATQQ
jgi:hypothetical protein